MNRRRKTNPLVIILIAAVVMVLITIGVIFILGGRFTTLDNGAKFLGEYESGQPVSGTIKYQNGTEATLDFFTKTITYDNGDIYVGDIKDGLRDGHGVMTFSATGDVYEGTFSKDEITGSGVFKYANGDVYEGSFLNSQKHGHGKFSSSNGNTYEGNYENDGRNGKGIFRWASGASYEGEFKNDLKNGTGIMTYENGDRYEGRFKDDMRDGERGLYLWANGERYNGTFRNNLMDTRSVDDQGNFLKDQAGNYVHGEMATYTFTTGRTYSGYFVEGKAIGINE